MAWRHAPFLTQLFLGIGLWLPILLWADADEIVQSIQLLGAISDKNSSSGKPSTVPKGVALLKHRSSGKVRAIRLGEDAFKLATLVQVNRRSVVLATVDGTRVTLSSKLAGARAPLHKRIPTVLANTETHYAEDGFERKGNQIRVDTAYRDRMVSKELPTILMSAASEPIMQSGKIKGFRLFQFEPDSIFAKMGMIDGDIVESINGVPLNDVARTIQFLNGLKDESAVEVNISRNGQPITLNLSVR